jgi:hypothetical protein
MRHNPAGGMSRFCRKIIPQTLEKAVRHGQKDAHGEVAEWLKAHAWKACIRETVSRVRIPLSPPAGRKSRSLAYYFTPKFDEFVASFAGLCTSKPTGASSCALSRAGCRCSLDCDLGERGANGGDQIWTEPMLLTRLDRDRETGAHQIASPATGRGKDR